jgi:PleD family two-component response regulator
MSSPSVNGDRSSLDAQDVIQAFARVTRRELASGRSVDVPHLGTFVSSASPDNPSAPAVLFAVEDAITRSLLADRLERRDVQTVDATDGDAALSILERTAVDVLVAETRLPGRTGFELLRRVPPHDPAVVLIGRRGNDAEVVKAFELGAADYITRPFAPEVAAARIYRFFRPTSRNSPPASHGV